MAAARGLRYRDFLTVAVVLEGRGPVPGQLDLHPRARGERGAHPELPLLEPVDGAGPGQGLRRPRVLLLPGRRPVGDGRRQARRARHARAREARPRQAPTSSSSGSSSGSRRPTRCTTQDYAERVHAIRSWLDGLDNFIQVGRNGLHRYNNSDHSMLTAMRAVDNLVKGTDHDIWAVNAESAYHEEEKQDEQQPYIEAPETEAMKEPLHQLAANAALRIRPRAGRGVPSRHLERADRRRARQRVRHRRGHPRRGGAAGAGRAGHRRRPELGVAVRRGLGGPGSRLPRAAGPRLPGRPGERRLSGLPRHGAGAGAGVRRRAAGRGRHRGPDRRRGRGLRGRLLGRREPGAGRETLARRENSSSPPPATCSSGWRSRSRSPPTRWWMPRASTVPRRPPTCSWCSRRRRWSMPRRWR